MKNSQTRLPLLNIMIKKSRRKIWVNIYDKPTDSKRYVPFALNHLQHCLTNILSSLARRICTIVKNENEKKNALKN